MTLGGFHLLTELFGRKLRRKRFLQLQGSKFVASSPRQQALDLVEFCLRLGIGTLNIVAANTRDEDDLLAVIVEADNLVEQHQVNIEKILTV